MLRIGPGSAPWPQAYVVTEAGGTWGTAQQVAGAVGATSVRSVSCASAGNCTAGGYSGNLGGAFVVAETGGIWGTAQEVPGSAALNAGGSAGIGSVSCASAGNCGAGGTYQDSSGHTQVFVADEKNP